MHLSAARAEITPEDLAEWSRKIETILAKPEYADIIKDPTRVFNNVIHNHFGLNSGLD